MNLKVFLSLFVVFIATIPASNASANVTTETETAYVVTIVTTFERESLSINSTTSAITSASALTTPSSANNLNEVTALTSWVPTQTTSLNISSSSSHVNSTYIAGANSIPVLAGSSLGAALAAGFIAFL